MTDRARVRMLLEIEAGSDPIVGTLVTHGGRREFSGWVGLATALERAIGASGDGTPSRSTGTNAPSTGIGELS